MITSFFKSGFDKLKKALGKSRDQLSSKIKQIFGRGKLDAETLEQLEKLFYEADLGVQTALELTDRATEFYRKHPQMDSEALIGALQEEVQKILSSTPPPKASEGTPQVILIVGVNGNGKTTSLAKLTHMYQKLGKKVLLAASDTFRAAATEQITTWAERLKADIVKGTPNSDPAAVAFDALQAGIARNADIILIDTAGRLHTKTNLMQEMQKIAKVCKKLIPEAPHQTFLVLDATTGQNGIDQAKTFHNYCPLTGLILTKLDGTAKGGVALNIQRQLNIPICYIGTGETLDDLAPFDAGQFAHALFHS